MCLVRMMRQKGNLTNISSVHSVGVLGTILENVLNVVLVSAGINKEYLF